MRRIQISYLLNNEDYQLPHLLKVKIAFLKLLKTEDLKTHLKNVKKMKTMTCAGSPHYDIYKYTNRVKLVTLTIGNGKKLVLMNTFCV